MKSVCHFILTVLWAIIIILSSITQICSSCVLEEKRALLDFKASINETEHPDLILPSWIDDDDDHPAAGSSDCCSWEGVKCSNTTGRIVELLLGDLTRDLSESNIDENYPKWYANLSILVPLESLQALNLSYNQFDSSIFDPCERLAAFKTLKSLNLDGNRMEGSRILGCLSAISSLKNLSLADNSIYTLEGCEGLSSFKNLESLNLDWNGLGNTSLQCIATISSLKYLSLVGESMYGLFPFKEINELKQLRQLDLSYNFFSGSVSFKELKLENLEILGLGWISDVDNEVEFSSIDVMTSLKALHLNFNQLKNSSIIQEICSLKNLVELDLSSNLFGGNVPLCLSNLTSLKSLDISYNNFSGSIPSLVISNLVHLEYLSLESNHFEGLFSFGSFANHSKLQVFKLRDQNKEIYVNFDGLPLPPPFQLRTLYLVQCNLNDETHRIPDFLLYQKELRDLDLSSNSLIGEFPNWLLENNCHFISLRLRNNSITGPFLRGDGTLVLQDLQELDISNNEVSGQVPPNVGLLFPSLEVFNLSINCFQGDIPESLGGLKKVVRLDLSHNNFSGEVPDRIGTGCVQLVALILSNNSLQGHFPSSSMNLTNLLVLYLDRNHFVGSISDGLSRSSKLMFVDISDNEFHGKIPSWIGNFSNLSALDLSRNMFEGTIPDDRCKLGNLIILDLSWNGLNGSILSCSTPSLIFIHLEWNQFTGSIPNALLNSSKDLISLNFRHNHLSGGIPHYITALTKLEVLLMGGNNLQGSFPVFICRLKNLNIMDLSQNNFSGRIPTCLNGISFGRGNFTSHAFTNWNEVIESFFPNSHSLVTSAYAQFYWREEVVFRTKSIASTYSGNILNYMSGIDLSGNQLTGEIPSELGDLSHLRALNLSHNYLQGSIPSRLSMLNLIESLDLSYNNLSGQIPYELMNLHSLSFFNVSYNNLSGRTPDQEQFANFDENNYRGNPSLCGPLLQQHCGGIIGKADPMQDVGNEYQNDSGIDTVAFFWGFLASMGTALAALALSLYLSREYRRVWFGLIDAWILFRFYRWYWSRSK